MRGALQMPAVLPRFARRACPAVLLPTCLLLSANLLLSACVMPGQGAADGPAAMQRFSPTDPALPRAGAQQTLIDELRARKSILPPDGPYATIADAVLRASSGAAQAELQMAQLQAEARAKNWLPSLGPRVSLTSLGTVVAQIMLEQAILDHGRRKAERAHAAGDHARGDQLDQQAQPARPAPSLQWAPARPRWAEAWTASSISRRRAAKPCSP